MPKKDPIEIFGFAEHVASFLLSESFRYVHEAAAYEVAKILFGRKLENIKFADPEWPIPEIPESLDIWLVSQNKLMEKVIDPKTAHQLVESWHSSFDEAYIAIRFDLF